MRTVQTTLTADGNTTSVFHRGGQVVFEASGTFGSGTMTPQFKPDGGSTFYPVGTALTAAGVSSVNLTAGSLRFALTGSTGPSIVPVINQLEQGKLSTDLSQSGSITKTNN